MGDIVVNIDQIYLWSENPRHSDEIKDLNIPENEVINILITTVGQKFMFNLANDILNEGLMGNIKPVVVEKNGKLLVYDGNRRVAAIKILKNPSIIDDENKVLRNNMISLIEKFKNFNLRIQELSSLTVFKTDENTAFRIIDKTHRGIMGGIGTLSWDAYQKDKANFKMNLDLEYPNAFMVVYKLGLKGSTIRKEKEYTSYERVFGNIKFKKLFKITDYNKVNKKYLQQIYELLIKYKNDIHKGMGLSRIFNKAAEESEIFYDWAKNYLSPEYSFHIRFSKDKIFLFKNQEMVSKYLNYNIYKHDGLPIKSSEIKMNKLEEKFISPNGEICSFDSSIVGEWIYEVKYYKSKSTIKIIVKDYVDPILTLSESRIILRQDQSITNLREYLIISTNGVGDNIKDDVEIFSKSAKIENDSFRSGNNINKHIVFYRYIDKYTSKEVTQTLEVTVIGNSDPIQPNPDITDKLLVFPNAKKLLNYFNKFGNSLKRIIYEINSLSISNYSYVLSASLRTVIQLLDEEYSAITGGKVGTNLNNQLSNLLHALTNDFSKNKIISKRESWVNNSKLLDYFRSINKNKQWLIDLLNCGSHSGGDVLTESQLISAGKAISQILTYIAILIYDENE